MCQITNCPVAARESDLILHGVGHGHAGQVHAAGVLHGDLVGDRATFLHTGSRRGGLGDLQAGPLGGDGQVLVGLDLRAGGVEGLRLVVTQPANQRLTVLGDVRRHGQLHSAITQLRHLVAGGLGILPVAGQGTLPRAAIGDGGNVDLAVNHGIGRTLVPTVAVSRPVIGNFRTHSRRFGRLTQTASTSLLDVPLGITIVGVGCGNSKMGFR